MLERLKTLFANEPSGASPPPAAGLPDLGLVKAWCQSKGWTLRPVRGDIGFIVDARSGSTAWRLEWGPAQRDYIAGQELRLRAELSLPDDLQVLLMSRSLLEPMEKRVFEEFVEDVQTRIDTRTPPEMRWLVMFPKLTGAELGALKGDLVCAGSHRAWVLNWVAASGVQALLRAAPAGAAPMVVTVSRGRLTLRTALAMPDVATVQTWCVAFDGLLGEALRVGPVDSLLAPSTLPSVWEASSLPPAQAEANDPAAAGRPLASA